MNHRRTTNGVHALLELRSLYNSGNDASALLALHNELGDAHQGATEPVEDFVLRFQNIVNKLDARGEGPTQAHMIAHVLTNLHPEFEPAVLNINLQMATAKMTPTQVFAALRTSGQLLSAMAARAPAAGLTDASAYPARGVRAPPAVLSPALQ